MFRIFGSFLTILILLCTTKLFCFQDLRLVIYEKDSLLTGRGQTLVTAGLPFARGELTSLSQIALFNGTGATELPAQFTPLIKHADGSWQWVLVDFLSSLAYRDTTRFIVKNAAKTASPSPALTVDSTAADYTINTGVIRFRVKRSNFNFIDALWHGSTQLLGGTGGGIKVNTGSDLWGTTVTACYFEYLGPVRATLRVDGVFTTAAQGGLTFRVRFHAFAGSDAIRIETSVRNASNPTYGAYTRVTGGGDVVLPFAAGLSGAARMAAKDTLVQNWQTAYNWYENGSFGLMAAARFAGGLTPEIQYNKFTFSGTSLMLNICRLAADLGDLSTIDKEVVLKAYAGAKTAGEIAQAVRAFRQPAYAVPETYRINAAHGFGGYQMGSFADEIALQRNHGADPAIKNLFQYEYGRYLANPLPGPQDGTYSPQDHKIVDCPVSFNAYGPHQPYMLAHETSEGDNLEALVQTWARCANPDILFQIRSWAGFYKTFFSLRTDGFAYDGQYNFDVISGSSVRQPKIYPLSGDALLARVDDIQQGGAGCCHIYGWGLGDYYAMTGDVEAREALTDLAEIAWVNDKNGNGRGGTRGFARRWQVVMRMWEITKDPVWYDRILEYQRQTLAKTWDPRGVDAASVVPSWEIGAKRLFANSATIPYLADEYANITDLGNTYITNSLFTDRMQGSSLRTWQVLGAQPWELSFEQDALYRCYKITGNESLRDHVIGKAQLLYRFNRNLICNRNFYQIALGFPTPDTVMGDVFAGSSDSVHKFLCGTLRFMSNAKITDPVSGLLTDARHSGYEDFNIVVCMGDAYEFTGEKKFLNWAWRSWSTGCRTPWNYYKFLCDTTVVGSYSYMDGGSWNKVAPVTRYFYTEINKKQDSVPPDRVTDLSISKTGVAGEWALSWTTPVSVGIGGETQIKWDEKPIVAYDDWTFKDHTTPMYARDAQLVYTANTWWNAQNIAGEPAPVPGAGQNCVLTVNKPAVYFALVLRDAAGNWSLMSNVIRGDASTAVAKPQANRLGTLSLAASPNPFSRVTRIAYNVPAAPGSNAAATLDVLDIRGRLIQRLVESDLKAGAYETAWTDRSPGSGVYILRLRVNNKTLIHKLMLTK